MEGKLYSTAPTAFQRGQRSEAVAPIVNFDVEPFTRIVASRVDDPVLSHAVSRVAASHVVPRTLVVSERTRAKPKGRSPPSSKNKGRKSSRSKSVGKVTRKVKKEVSTNGEDLSAKVELMLFRLEQKRRALSQKSYPSYKRPSLKLLSTDLSGITSSQKARPFSESPLPTFEKVFAPNRKEVAPLFPSPSSNPRRHISADDSMRRNLSTEALPNLHAGGSQPISNLNDMESMALESLCELSRASVCDFPAVKESLLSTQLPLWV